MTFEPSLNRRQLFRAAATVFAAAAASEAFVINPMLVRGAEAPADVSSDNAPDVSSPGKQPAVADDAPPAASVDKDTPPTAEGASLADAALASAGHPIPDDSETEVRKQLGSYPGTFRVARKYDLANSDAPHFGVTPAL